MAHGLTAHRPPAALLRILLLLALCAMMLAMPGCDEEVVAQDTRLPVTLGGRTFQLELALTKEARFQGLSDRETIDADGGMLFVFASPEKLSFVMRRCLVPIDIIFLDPGGRIISMYEMQVEPDPYAPDDELKRYTSRWPAQYAIELKGGTLRTLNIERGDKVDLPTEQLRDLAE